jgi:SAM-dependent methyltransferase
MDATAWDQRYAATERLWSAGPNKFLPDLVKDLQVGRALDLACGEGRNAIWLAQEGWQIVGVDFSVTAIERAWDAARAFKCDCNFIVADLREWQVIGEFDLITEFYLHPPKSDLTDIRHRAMTALKPGGRYLVVGHHVENLAKGVGGPQDPAVLHTVESVTADLPGLEVEIGQKLMRTTDLGPAIDTVVRLKRSA